MVVFTSLDFIHMVSYIYKNESYQVKKMLHWQAVSNDNNSTNAVAKYTNYLNDDSVVW